MTAFLKCPAGGTFQAAADFNRSDGGRQVNPSDPRRLPWPRMQIAQYLKPVLREGPVSLLPRCERLSGPRDPITQGLNYRLCGARQIGSIRIREPGGATFLASENGCNAAAQSLDGRRRVSESGTGH